MISKYIIFLRVIFFDGTWTNRRVEDVTSPNTKRNAHMHIRKSVFPRVQENRNSRVAPPSSYESHYPLVGQRVSACSRRHSASSFFTSVCDSREDPGSEIRTKTSWLLKGKNIRSTQARRKNGDGDFFRFSLIMHDSDFNCCRLFEVVIAPGPIREKCLLNFSV